jgi:hypothetical protein
MPDFLVSSILAKPATSALTLLCGQLCLCLSSAKYSGSPWDKLQVIANKFGLNIIGTLYFYNLKLFQRQHK